MNYTCQQQYPLSVPTHNILSFSKDLNNFYNQTDQSKQFYTTPYNPKQC